MLHCSPRQDQFFLLPLKIVPRSPRFSCHRTDLEASNDYLSLRRFTSSGQDVEEANISTTGSSTHVRWRRVCASCTTAGPSTENGNHQHRLQPLRIRWHQPKRRWRPSMARPNSTLAAPRTCEGRFVRPKLRPRISCSGASYELASTDNDHDAARPRPEHRGDRHVQQLRWQLWERRHQFHHRTLRQHPSTRWTVVSWRQTGCIAAEAQRQLVKIDQVACMYYVCTGGPAQT